jgi:hypothetical protein
VRVACYCGTVYQFSYDGTCPDCGSEVFAAVKPPQEASKDFADRMAEFVRTGMEIAGLPETEER